MSAGMRKPSSVMPLLKSSELTSGLTLQPDDVAGDRRPEIQLHAEFLEEDRHRGREARALHHRHRELAAREEARLLAVVGDQVRLGERLKQPLLLERLDDGAEAFLPVEVEDVQEVAEHQPAPASSSKSGAGNCCVVTRPVSVGPLSRISRHARAPEARGG